MLVAALDTATLTLSCALVDLAPDGAVALRRERVERAPAKAERGTTGGHAARLPGVLEDLLAGEGLALADVEAFAIGLGPGSFTGLRIGLATWKGLAYALGRPLAGASSLAALALAAAPDARPGALLVPLLDAKKGEVYSGFYRAEAGGVVAVAPDAALPPAALASRVAALGGEAVAFGEGYAAHAAVLERDVPRLATPLEAPPGLAVAALAREALRAVFDPQKVFALEPHYVRPSEAELKFPHGLGPGATTPGPR